MVTKPNTSPPEQEETKAPAFTGAFFMHVDDFLNLVESEIHQIEALSAFGKLQKRLGVVKQDLSKWRSDWDAFLHAIPR